MKSFIRISSLLMLLGLTLTAHLAQAAHGTLNYQGKLTTAADVAVPDGPYPAQFTLWTDSTGGMQVWSEPQDISVSKGLFTVELGKIVSLFDVFSRFPDQDVYLQTVVMINGTPQTMAPRMRIGSVPYAQSSRRLIDDTASNVGEAIFTSSAPNGSSSLRVLSLNGLPPGEPVMGTLMTADADSATIEVTGVDGGAIASEYKAKAGKTGATKRLVFVSGSTGSSSIEHADADSAATELKTTDGTTTVKYTAKAGKTGSAKRMIYQDGSDEASSSESADADSVVFEQSYKTATTEIKYKAKQGTSGSAKRESASNGDDSSSSDEFTSPDSIVSADTLKENGTVLVTYKATTGKTGKAKQSLRVIPGTGSESETNEYSSADSTVYDETFTQNGGMVAKYTAKQGKTGSASGKRLIGGGSSSSSNEEITSDSMTHADSISNGAESTAYTQSLTVPKMAISLNFSRSGSSSISAQQQTADSTIYTDSISGGTQSSAYKATQGKSGKAAKAKFADDGDESSSEERMTADSIITADSVSDNTGSLAAYTAKQGKTGSAKQCKIVDDDDESSSSERMAVDSIVHDESTTVNGVVVTQYTAKQGSTGRTKRTMQNSGGHEYASVEEVDNNGARLYLTQESVTRDTGFYADAEGNLVVVGNNGSSGIEIRSSGGGRTNVKGRLAIGVPNPTHPLELASGAHCTAGGVFTNASDVNLKENFQPVDEAALLDKVEQLPINQWNYKNEGDDVTHIGPTAQDFKAIFGVGDNDKSISTIDPAGIALAAIKELRKENRDLKGENAELKKRLDDLQKKVEALISNK